jgi:S-adenosylmethionine hydrolase
MPRLVTLTTDFGAGSAYAAAVKGALLAVNPEAALVDLSHHIPPQDLHYTAFFLRACVPYFPPATLHVVVVDPGVGSERAILYVELAEQQLLVPDNGCWTALVEAMGPPRRVLRLTESRFWRPQVSNTFHGRDIFAPVAGHLSRDIDPALLGVPTDTWVNLALPQPHISEIVLEGEVIFIDDFGNLLTNIPAGAFQRFQERGMRVWVGGAEIAWWVRTYAEAVPGTAVALISSSDTLEIAVCQGHAARHFQACVKTSVRVELAG